MYDLLQEDGSTEVKDTKPADPQARKKVDKREKSRRGGAHGGRGGVVVKSGGELVTQTRPKKKLIDAQQPHKVERVKNGMAQVLTTGEIQLLTNCNLNKPLVWKMQNPNRHRI